jgi:hypothetical protein
MGISHHLPPHKDTGQTDFPHHPGDTDNDGADDDNANNNAAEDCRAHGKKLIWTRRIFKLDILYLRITKIHIFNLHVLYLEIIKIHIFKSIFRFLISSLGSPNFSFSEMLRGSVGKIYCQ